MSTLNPATPASATLPLGMDSKPEPNTTLHGSLLTTARAAWATIFVLTWVCFIHSLFLEHTIAGAMLYISQDRIPFYTTSLDIVLMLVCSAVAGLIMWRRSDDWVGLLTSITIVTFGAAQTFAVSMLIRQPGTWITLALGVEALGDGLMLILLFVFPDGRFVPSWTKVIAVAWTAWVITWPFVPAISPLLNQMPTWSIFVIFTVLYMSGFLSQIHRRMTITNPVKRLQAKWTILGFGIALLGFLFTNLALYGFGMMQPGTVIPALSMGLPIFSTLTILAIPCALGISIMRFRLWDFDPLIHQTVVYGTVTTGLTVFFFAEVICFQAIFRAITGQQSDIALVLSTLIIAALFQPVRTHMRTMIDHRFYHEKIDFEQAFTDFSQEIRTIIDMRELGKVLLTGVMDLLHITYGVVFLRSDDGSFHVVDKRIPEEACKMGTTPASFMTGDAESLRLTSDVMSKLSAGQILNQPQDLSFAAIVPLFAPRRGGQDLVGMLAYGPRLSGEDYGRSAQTLLRHLADQAGTAMYVASLIDAQRNETTRREQAERALETHRQSPLGRAETVAEAIAAHPETAVAELHALTEKAGTDPETAALLSNLNRALEKPETEPISQLAGGYLYLYRAETTPELLTVGLRMLISQLETPPTVTWAGSPETLMLYRVAQKALCAQTIPQITGLGEIFKQEIASCPTTSPDNKPTDIADIAAPPFLEHLKHALTELESIADTLHAYERVDTTRDKLGYLVGALERLSRVAHMARTVLGAADRALILRMIENWLAVVSNAMSEIQTRAQISCRLLTHHTWQDDVISLSLSLRNDGHGAALNVRVNLAPSAEYTVVDPAVVIERLGPDEESQVDVRIRPRLAQSVDQFRARFIVHYSDPRGSDQIEHFADVVYLLTSTSEFQFIPNPYVVGTPLASGSPLFFGREDVVGFINENLSAAHRNNLVLIGHRRTGKTSLLKQLPRRLGDDYLPVYLDGQALSLDPGMPNFFLNLATEINFSIEDHNMTPPTIPNFTDSPAATFERTYLTAVRETIGDRHLLILFDEFEELEGAVRRGNLDSSVFNFLRHMIQHIEKISVIFCGTHHLEELASDYWSVLFNISLYRNIGFLEHAEALKLIQEPVAKYGMRYDDLALDKMWRVTAGHPYFLQLLCHSLVNRHNKTKRSYVTVADVNAAVDEILAAGEAHFVYMWTESTPQERLALAALSRMLRLTGRATLVQIVDYLEDRGIHMERPAMSAALHRLVLGDAISESDDTDAGGEVYRWQLGLLGMWVEKYKSMSRVADEARAVSAV